MAAKLKKIKSVKELRKHMMLTQVEFAQKINVDQPLVSSWENGRYEPSLESFKKMVKIAKSKGVILELE